MFEPRTLQAGNWREKPKVIVVKNGAITLPKGEYFVTDNMNEVRGVDIDITEESKTFQDFQEVMEYGVEQRKNK